MVQQIDIGHGRGWLAPAPAASIRRVDAHLARLGLPPLGTSSTGRSAADQQALIDAAAAGDPNVFMPARVGESPHQWGISADVPGYRDVEPLLNEHGWYRPLPKADPVHFNYDPARDQHINDPIGGFLMALTDKQQDQLYEWTNRIQQALFNGNQIVGPEFRPIDVLTSHAIATQALVAKIAATGDEQTKADAAAIVDELSARLRPIE